MILSRISPLFKLNQSEVKFSIHHLQMLLISEPLDWYLIIASDSGKRLDTNLKKIREITLGIIEINLKKFEKMHEKIESKKFIVLIRIKDLIRMKSILSAQKANSLPINIAKIAIKYCDVDAYLNISRTVTTTD